MIPAIVTAGDRGAATRPVYGESKVYLEIDGVSLVRRVVSALQRVPEISEVWVVGDTDRLTHLLAPIAEELRKPVHLVPQFRNLYENCWETYRRLLPGAGPQGRDPTDADLDQQILYLSADLPFATPHEISHFVRTALAFDCDFAVGLSSEASIRAFEPEAPGEPGIRMACFNLREGRFRQNNMHLVRPGRLAHRFYIEEMYRHRYQQQFGAIVRMAWRLFRARSGTMGILGYYGLLHAASLADRHGWRLLADGIRRFIPVASLDRGLSNLLGTRFRFVPTELGGCAVDIDNEPDCDAARARFGEWAKMQRDLAESLVGPLPLPERTGNAGLSILPENEDR